MNISGLHIYSYGVSLENKPLNTKDLRVVPMEIVPFIQGEVAENDTEIKVTGVDRFGNNYTASSASTNAVTAEWLPLGSNRATAPDIRRGERIILFRYKNVDEFFWVVDGRDEHLRRLETVIYRYSNSRDEGEVTITDDNSWSLTVSTHEKHITLKTTKNDGEPFAYTFQINAKEGIVVLTDNATDDGGNYIELNSRDTNIIAKNIDGTYVELNKKVLNLHALDEINITTKTLNIKTQAINETTDTITTNASSSINTNTSTNTITATTTHNGAATITGTTTIGGGMSVSGGASINGSLTNNGTDVGSEHIHPKGSTTQPNTFPPV